MITPSSGSVVVPQQTFDGIWINNISITGPSPKGKVMAQIVIIPFNSSTGEMAPSNQRKSFIIKDVFDAASSSSYAAAAIQNIYGFVQEQIVSKSLF